MKSAIALALLVRSAAACSWMNCGGCAYPSSAEGVCSSADVSSATAVCESYGGILCNANALLANEATRSMTTCSEDAYAWTSSTALTWVSEWGSLSWSCADNEQLACKSNSWVAQDDCVCADITASYDVRCCGAASGSASTCTMSTCCDTYDNYNDDNDISSDDTDISSGSRAGPALSAMIAFALAWLWA